MSNITQGLFKHIPCPNGDACTAVRCLFKHGYESDGPGVLRPVDKHVTISVPLADTSGSSGAPSTGLSDHGAAPEHGPSARPVRGPAAAATANQQPHATDDSAGNGGGRHATKKARVERRDEHGAGASNSPRSDDALRLHFAQTRLDGRLEHPRPESPTGSISPPPLKRKRENPTSAHDAPDAAAQTSPPGVTARAASVTATAVSAASAAAASALPPASSATLAGATGASSPASMAKKVAAPLPKRKPEVLNPRYVAKSPARHEIRLRLLKLLHAEFTRLNKALIAARDRPEDRKQYVLTEQGLIWAALDMEEHYATTKSATVYSDTIKHRIMEFKRMTMDQWVTERRDAKEKARQRRQAAVVAAAAAAAVAQPSAEQSTGDATGSGQSKGVAFSAAAAATASTASPTIDTPPPPPKPIVTGLSADQELGLLTKHFLTPIDKLARQGYVPTIPTAADIQKARDAEEVSKGWEQCDRCTRRFQVFPGRREDDGALASGGPCRHHPGRLNRLAQVFSCCNEAADASTGCETTDNHVFKVKDPKRMAALWNFAETPANPDAPAHPAVCFDCEMAYTVHGMEVVRLTVTAWPDGRPLLDVLVRPIGEIIDLNSRFSGVWPRDFAAAVPFSGTSAKDLRPQPSARAADSTDAADAGHAGGVAPPDRPPLPIVSSPQVARALFHSLIGPDTVLIGHALENDLNAMRMVHPRLADTVLLFPHPKGLPIRYGLRVLAKEHMGRTIQTGVLTGHDSAEDARAAGDLVRTKIRAKWEDMRIAGWMLVDGEMQHGSKG